MKQFCFNLRDASNGQRLIAGTVSGETMEECAILEAKRLHLVIERTLTGVQLWYKDKKVNLHITAIPEYVLLGKIPEFSSVDNRVIEDYEEYQ